MVAGQVAPRLHEEPAQARQERARREDDVRGAIGARRLERVDELAVARQREPAERERPSGSVTSQRPRRIPWKSRSAALAYGGLQDVRSRGTAALAYGGLQDVRSRGTAAGSGLGSAFIRRRLGSASARPPRTRSGTSTSPSSNCSMGRKPTSTPSSTTSAGRSWAGRSRPKRSRKVPSTSSSRRRSS